MFTSIKLFCGFYLIGCLCFCEAKSPKFNLLNLPIGSDCIQPNGVKGICTSFLDCTSLHTEIRARRLTISDLYYYRCSFVVSIESNSIFEPFKSWTNPPK